MDVVNAATVGAIAACAALVLLTTTKHGQAEPFAVTTPGEASSRRSALDVAAAASAVQLLQSTSHPDDASQAGALSDVRGPGASPVRRSRLDAGIIASWEEMIVEASRRFGVPAAWVRAVMQVESAGRTELNGRPITSPAGAMGLMQVMPETFAEMTRRYRLGSDPYDPRANILAGTAFLRELYDRFGAEHFLAAYNAGPSRVEDHLRTGRPLPEETRRYVQALAPRLVGSTPGDGSTTSTEVRDLTSLQALRDAARSPSRRVAALFPTPGAASLFVASHDRSSASDRRLHEQTIDAPVHPPRGRRPAQHVRRRQNGGLTDVQKGAAYPR